MSTPHNPDVFDPDVFADRHLGPRGREVSTMLDQLGIDTMDTLVDLAVPKAIRTQTPLNLPAARTEAEVLAHLRELAGKNQVKTQMIGQGYYDTHTPAVIRRNVLESPAWYTAYTPYQPEISQGRLEALLNFQTVVEDLTGLPIANASLLDEATAVAEAVALMRRASRAKEGDVVLDADLLRQTLAVAKGRAEAIGLPVVVADLSQGLQAGLAAAAPTAPRCPPASRRPRAAAGRGVGPRARPARRRRRGQGGRRAGHGRRRPARPDAPGQPRRARRGHRRRFRAALRRPAVLRRPARRLHGRQKGLERQLPGRLVGVSIDDDGAAAYRLALQTREQHIRREKATSNICTAQALLAIVASMYAVYHGPDGLQGDRRPVHGHARHPGGALRAAGVDGRARHLLRHDPRRRPGQGQGSSSGRSRGAASTSASQTPTTSRSPRTRPRRRRTSQRSPTTLLTHAGSGARSKPQKPTSCARTPSHSDAPRRTASEPPTTCSTRCSTRTAPRPACCATCASSPTRTWRWTAR